MYKVRSIDWQEDEDDFIEFPGAIDVDDAAHEWCKFGDSNSWFVDGYPEDHELEVLHPDGTRTRHEANTEWSPDFYVHDKEVSSS
jgi:hypothetical protein